jgi:hypothetical protein
VWTHGEIHSVGGTCAKDFKDCICLVRKFSMTMISEIALRTIITPPCFQIGICQSSISGFIYWIYINTITSFAKSEITWVIRYLHNGRITYSGNIFSELEQCHRKIPLLYKDIYNKKINSIKTDIPRIIKTEIGILCITSTSFADSYSIAEYFSMWHCDCAPHWKEWSLNVGLIIVS